MNNKGFILILIAATALVFTVMAENIRPAVAPVNIEAEIEIDTSGIKANLMKAGLKPREAMHWKEIK